VANSVEDMDALLDIVHEFNTWLGIRLNVDKCKITAYIQALQIIRKKRDRDDALGARRAHVSIGGRPMSTLTHDEPLSRGYLGTALTASLCRNAHLHWIKNQVTLIWGALKHTSLPPNIRQQLLLYGVLSKVMHIHCLMALSPAAMREVDSILESTATTLWKLPSTFP
jgi:hypothetical protein